jgi:peptidoglycan/xylan/chitin deacetylase (PgdA/CDA1 family)
MSVGIRQPFIFRFFNKRYLTCKIPNEEQTIFLTFDDGPVPEVTPQVLKILERRSTKATFFCIGDNVKKYPELFQQVKEAGHAIGNHTFNHMNGWKTPTGQYVDNVMRCNEYVGSSLFRPPYGRFTISQYLVLRKKFRFILWSVLSRDFDPGTTPDQCFDNVMRVTTSGSVIVFHDSVKAKEKVLFVLPRFIDQFLEKGFRFGTIPYSSKEPPHPQN